MRKSTILEKYLNKKILSISQTSHLLLPLYINHIRNNRELTIEMLEDISTLSDEHKMVLIIEFNRTNQMKYTQKTSI